MKKAIVWMGVVVLFALFFSYRYENLFQQKGTIPVSVKDNNRNGFPDEMELYGEDAKNFYMWFSCIAISQHYAKSKNWNSSFDSPSGLLRFCFIEALKKHTPYWFKMFPYIFKADIPPVKKYNYPDVPVVGINVFRGGKDRFAKRVTLKQLIEFNFTKVKKDISDLEPGDMLLFQTGTDDYVVLICVGRGLFVYQRCIEDKSKIVLLTGLPDMKYFKGVYNWSVVHR